MQQQWMQDMAINLFVQRALNPPPKIDNASLTAGSPMVYYCQHCGWYSDVKQEEWVYLPRDTCSECEGLKREGLLAPALLALVNVRR